MTTDFKTLLLDYFTGNLAINEGSNVPTFNEYTQSSNNIRNVIATQLETTYDQIIIRHVLYNDIYNKFIVLLNNNSVSPSQVNIAIIDENFDVLQIINTFNDNSTLFHLIMLNIDETGNFYGISNDNNVIRLLLFNNILASGEKTGNYEIILRKSYIIPDEYQFTISVSSRSNYIVVKAKNESIYYITGYDASTPTTLKVLQFQINVGSSNTWTLYTQTNASQPALNNSVLLQKTSNGIIYNLYTLYSENNSYYYRQYQINEEGEVSLYSEIELTINFAWSSSQVLVLNSNNIYLVLADINTNNTYIYKINSNALDFIYSNQGYNSNCLIYLNNINNNIFVSVTNPLDTGFKSQSVGMIINVTIYLTNIGQTSNASTLASSTDFLITNKYNLYNIYVISDTTNEGQTPVYINKTIQLIYNSNNYNGAEYTNVNSLVPNSAVLFNNDENPKIVFARNLYNKVINNNTTVSTIQIPNTLLNNTTIQNKSLYSQTNNNINYDLISITKNIYETLNINFFNTINMLNNNNTNNPIYNTLGAIRINNSISQDTDYNNAQLNKIKINYNDNTNQIFNIETPTITNNIATYRFTVYVSKDIINIQMISNDETTVYQTINGNFELNKYYTITQDVSVE